VGLDGISVLFLPLTALLFTGVILASWNSVRHLPRLYYSLLLLLEAPPWGCSAPSTPSCSSCSGN
jgi:NADH-quinone oxidoreductase subunit M